MEIAWKKCIWSVSLGQCTIYRPRINVSTSIENVFETQIHKYIFPEFEIILSLGILQFWLNKHIVQMLHYMAL